MMLALVSAHGPVLLDAPQHVLAAGGGVLQKIGKAIFAIFAGVFIVGALVGLLIGFFVGRAVGRRSSSESVGS